MTNLSFHLYQLQKIDLRIDQIDTRAKRIKELIDHNQALQEADALLKTAEANVAQKNAEISELENASLTKTIKIEQSEASLYKGGNQNPKELADLQKEIASLKHFLSMLEEEQFTKLSELETLTAELSMYKTSYQSIYDEWQNANRSLMVEMEDIKKERERLSAERQAVLSQVLPESQSLYEKLRLAKNRIAVTSIEEESCTICGAEITAADIQKAKNATTLSTCPSCGRILYTG
jgi:predicted  nucleic acid-binding Zn-ribbon protein